MRSVPNQSATPFLHIAETDCVAGVVGLELPNPLGSKSARVAAGSSGYLVEMAHQRLFAFSCGVANTQPRFLLTWPTQGLTHHDGRVVQYAWLVGFEPWNAQRK
jgi:hypothetical protein